MSFIGKIKKLFKKTKALLLLGIILVLLAPFVFTLPNFWQRLNFTETGQIGDTIAGITSPITSLIGSILVFQALKAQIHANELIIEQFAHQKIEAAFGRMNNYITEELRFIRTDIDNISYKDTYGLHAILNHLRNFGKRQVICGEDKRDNKKIPVDIYKVQNILKRILHLIESIDKSDIDGGDKKFLQSSISLAYNEELYPVLRELKHLRISKIPSCNICGKIHYGIPETIYINFDKINSALGIGIKNASI